MSETIEKPRFRAPLSPMETFKRNFPLIIIYCLLSAVNPMYVHFFHPYNNHGIVTEIIGCLFILIGFLYYYFLLCLCARITYVMVGTKPEGEGGFFYYGFLIIKDAIVFGLLFLVTIYISMRIYYTGCSILHITTPNETFYLKNHVSKNGFFILVYFYAIISIYIFPIAVFKRMYPYETSHISRNWILIGIKFLFRNLKISIPAIALLFFNGLLARLSIIYKVNYIASAFLGLPYVLANIVALHNFLLYGTSGMFAKKNIE